MSAHSYWRVLFTQSPGNASIVVIDLLAFFDFTGTLIPTTGGTASASSTQSGYSPANAFDGSVNGTWWVSNGTVTPTTPEWLAYQFASPVDVASFELAPRQSWPDQWPVDFALQFSDNGSTWTTLYQYYGAFSPGNSSTSTQSWTCGASNAAPSSVGVIWRLLITATQGATVAAIGALRFYDSSNTLIPTSGLAGIASSTAGLTANECDGASAAFDSETFGNTYWASNSTPSSAAPEWVGFQFANAAIAVSRFCITSRNSATSGQSPTQFSLQYSLNGGLTWVTVNSFTSAPWTTLGQTQCFGNAAQPFVCLVF